VTVTKINRDSLDEKTTKRRRLFVSAGKSVLLLVLLVIFSVMILSSELILRFDYDENPVKLSDKINSINGYYDSMEPTYDGVSMRTEFDTYSPDTTRIMVYWENNTDQEFLFGESWQLFKKQGNEFVPLFNLNGNYGFTDVGYPLKPGKQRKQVYWIEPFTDKLTPGIYQIKTYFLSGSGDTLKLYELETEFTVSDDKSKWDVSALDFLNGKNASKFIDITGEAYNDTSFRLYKNKKTYGTILTDGTYEYEIGQGSGKWGITYNDVYEADGKVYLVYSYSRDVDGRHCSYLCVSDVTDNAGVKEVYKSDPFYSDYDVGVVIDIKYTADGYVVIDENEDYVMDNRFKVFYVKYEEDEYGGVREEGGSDIGWLVYENGGFHFEQNTD